MKSYRNLNLWTLSTPQYNHLLLLLFWPVFLICFQALEEGPTTGFAVMHCALDNLIPFNELFVIPYVFWFAFIPGMLLYTVLYDTPQFRRLMWFIATTYFAAIIIYLIYPTCQNLRPEVMPRDNFLTRVMAYLYENDTNTNVCPSIHVIGAVGVAMSAFNCDRFKSFGWRLGFAVCALLITMSTVFCKQHSIIDVVCAVPVCVAGYLVCYKTDLPLVGCVKPAKAKLKNRKVA